MDFLFAIARDFNVAKAETMFRQVSKVVINNGRIIINLT